MVKILALLLPLMMAVSCTTPTMRIVPLPDSDTRGSVQTKLRMFCWAQYGKSDGGQSVLYFIFNENNEVTYFYHHFNVDVNEGKGGDRISTTISKCIKEGDDTGVRIILKKGAGKVSINYGEKAKGKRIYFIFDGKERLASEMDFPSLEVKENERRWVFEVTKGVDLPKSHDEIVPDPHKFMVRQYKRNQ